MTNFAELNSPDDWSAAEGKPNSHEGRIEKGALLLDSEQGSNIALFHPRSAHAYLMVPEREQMRAVLQLKGSATYLTKVTRRNMCGANLKVVPLSSSAQDGNQRRRNNRVRVRSMVKRKTYNGGVEHFPVNAFGLVQYFVVVCIQGKAQPFSNFIASSLLPTAWAALDWPRSGGTWSASRVLEVLSDMLTLGRWNAVFGTLWRDSPHIVVYHCEPFSTEATW